MQRVDLAVQADRRAFWAHGRGVIQHLLHVAGYAAEVAALHVGVQVQGRFDVVVGHHRRALHTGDGCHTAEDLRLPVGAGDGQRFQ